VILPARQKGYQEIWLTGASMGGMGALLYERAYPRDVTGLVLYAPYLGAPGVIRKIAAAGGPAQWNPGPVPAEVNADNYETEMWRVVKGWQEPAAARRIWVGCGASDRFIASCRILAGVLTPDHYVELPGGHDWSVWNAAAAEIFRRIAASQ
jgi:pimeloyl-ACP methyl ester carboxylesterase